MFPHRDHSWFKALLCLCAALVLSACATTAERDPQPIKSPGDDYTYRLLTLDNGLEVLLISNPDTPKAAAALDINVGSGDNSEVTVAGIVFTPSQLSFPSGTGDGGYFTGDGGDTGDADLNLLLDSHAWGAASTTVTLSGLTVGMPYELQLIGAADTRSCCSDRNQAASDGVNVSGDMSRVGPGSVIGSFTADADTQDFMIVPGTENGVDPGISAYMLRTIPEPTSVTIVGFALCGLMLTAIRRNRA